MHRAALPTRDAPGVVLRAVTDTPDAYAFTSGPDGRLELFGDAGRDLVLCRFGALGFPLELCEERFVVSGLVARVLAGDGTYLDP